MRCFKPGGPGGGGYSVSHIPSTTYIHREYVTARIKLQYAVFGNKSLGYRIADAYKVNRLTVIYA